MDDLTHAIDQLESLRVLVAERTRTLAERELDARMLRLAIECDYRKSQTKTDAEKSARTDDRYVAHERETVVQMFNRDVALAKAEATRLRILAQLGAISVTGSEVPSGTAS